MTTIRGLFVRLHCSQATSVPTASWEPAPTTTTAPSATRKPLSTWPAKSKNPGASRMLILKPLCSANATPRLIEILRFCSSGSKSVVAVAWSGAPMRWIVPEANNIASASMVLPSWEWPSRTTFLILSEAYSVAIQPPSTPVAAVGDDKSKARLRAGWLGYHHLPDGEENGVDRRGSGGCRGCPRQGHGRRGEV